MAPSLMRFSISGRIQYLIESLSCARRWTSVTSRPRPIELEGGDGGGVLSSHHDHRLAVVPVRLRVVVGDVRPLLAGNAEEVGMVVVAGGEGHVAGATRGHALRAARLHHEAHGVGRHLRAPQAHDLLPERHVQAVGVGDLAVVLEALDLGGLLVRRDEGQAPDLEQVRGGEERHVAREVEDGVDERALLHDFVAEPGLVSGDGGGQAAGSGADDEEIEGRGHASILHRARRVIPARRLLHGQDEVGTERAARRLEARGHAAREYAVQGQESSA